MTASGSRRVVAALGVAFALALVGAQLTFAEAPESSHLVAYFPGDGAATEVIANQPGTVEGGATFAPGKVGQAFSLDGTHDAVEFPGGAWQLPAGDFSVLAWVKTSDATDPQIVIEEYECGGFCPGNNASSMWRLGLDKGRAVGIVREQGTPADATEVVGAAVADGQWHHIAFVRDTINGKALIYVDGSLSISSTLTPDMDGPLANADGDQDPVVIGAHVIGGTSNLEQFFNGEIDEVGFYDEALGADEVAAIAGLGAAGAGLDSATLASPGASEAAAPSTPVALSAAPSATTGIQPTASSADAGPATSDNTTGPALGLPVLIALMVVIVALVIVWRSRRRSA